MARSFRYSADTEQGEVVSKKKERRNRKLANMSKSRLGFIAIANHITSDLPPEDDYGYDD